MAGDDTWLPPLLGRGRGLFARLLPLFVAVVVLAGTGTVAARARGGLPGTVPQPVDLRPSTGAQEQAGLPTISPSQQEPPPSPRTDPSADPPPAPVTPTESSPPPASTPGRPASLLSGRESVPPGLAEQFAYFELGDDPCTEFESETTPAVGFHSRSGTNIAYVLDDIYICLPGFDPGADTFVDVTPPSGDVLHLAPQPEDESLSYNVLYVLVEIPLYAETGTWEVAAQQDERIASGSFTVEQPNAPDVQVEDPRTGPAGSTFVIHLAGHPPSTPVVVDVYARSSESDVSFVTTLAGPSTDSLGRTEYRLATAESDPAGTYCVVPQGGPAGCTDNALIIT